MGIGNRTETKTNVTSKIAATVTVAKHTEVLNDDLISSIVFRKDVIETPPVSSGSYTLNCSLYDQAVMTITGDVTVSFSDLQDGDIAKKLIVNKQSANVVSFSGVTGTMEGQQVGKTVLHYRIWSANSKIYVIQENRQSGGTLEIGDMQFYSAGGLGTVDSVSFCRYVINDNIVKIFGTVTGTTPASGTTDYVYLVLDNTSLKMGSTEFVLKAVAGAGGYKVGGIEYPASVTNQITNATNQRIFFHTGAGTISNSTSVEVYFSIELVIE